MRIRYDPEVDALYIQFVDGSIEVTTQRLSEDVAVDYGPGGTVVGIEVLDASQNVFGSETERNVLLENLNALTS